MWLTFCGRKEQGLNSEIWTPRTYDCLFLGFKKEQLELGSELNKGLIAYGVVQGI